MNNGSCLEKNNSEVYFQIGFSWGTAKQVSRCLCWVERCLQMNLSWTQDSATCIFKENTYTAGRLLDYDLTAHLLTHKETDTSHCNMFRHASQDGCDMVFLLQSKCVNIPPQNRNSGSLTVFSVSVSLSWGPHKIKCGQHTSTFHMIL